MQNKIKEGSATAKTKGASLHFWSTIIYHRH